MQRVHRSFADDRGRQWRVSELFAPTLARDLATCAGDREVPVPLVFESGNDRRLLARAPTHWWDLARECLQVLLDRSRSLSAECAPRALTRSPELELQTCVTSPLSRELASA